jgi:hypothetical protein
MLHVSSISRSREKVRQKMSISIIDAVFYQERGFSVKRQTVNTVSNFSFHVPVSCCLAPPVAVSTQQTGWSFPERVVGFRRSDASHEPMDGESINIRTFY